MPYDVIDRESIKSMVHDFYSKILQDALLGPIFTRALGDDLSKGKWLEHFGTLDSFWLMIMTGKRGYNGDPFPPHAFLGPLEHEHFEIWLKLFKETVSEFYTPELAAKFYRKADILATQFIENLGIDDEDDD